MANTDLKNLYSPTIIFDEVAPLKPKQDNYNYNLVNDLYIYKDNKKCQIHETEPNNDFINNYIESFLINSRKGDH